VNPSQTPLGTIQGSDYGGHAPLVGAHVYVLQPSVTTPTATSAQTASFNAYGGQATSLLSATYSNNGANYPATIQNTSDAGIPSSWYYLKTDLTGAFNITGDYTCTAGVPVYLYLYGGSPIYPSANNTFTITNLIWSNDSSGTGYDVTMTISTTGAQSIENAYIGEFFTVNNLNNVGSANISSMNGSDQVVLAKNLTTTTFSYYQPTLPSGTTVGTNYAQTGTNQVTFDPTFNPGVVNLAVLGVCPDNGTLAGTGTFSGSSAISYVYVNEVATAAAAYAFRPFTFTPQTGAQGYQTDCLSTYNGTTYDWANATCIGTSSTNLAGLQNAAKLAAQLYDITGSNLSTTYAGEGHIARSLTTNGNGIVPQANIDTLGNILAACVDSNNGSVIVGTSGGYNGTTGAYSGISAQCNTLFSNATSNGVISTASSGAGIQAFDIAQAAINIARHPAGPPYSVGSTAASTYMTNLYTLPAGNPPFSPSLASTGAGQPNDFTIGIVYTAANNPGPDGYALTTGLESVAIDKIGNVWFTSQPNKGSGAGYMYEMSPTGVPSNVQYNSSWIYGYVGIDTGQSAWAGSAISSNYITYVHATSTPAATTGANPPTYTYATGVQRYSYGTTNYNYTYPAFGDNAGNMYFTNNYVNNSSSAFIAVIPNAATAPTNAVSQNYAMPDFTSTGGTYPGTDGQGLSHAATAADATSHASYVYTDYNAANGNGTPQIGRNSLADGTNATTGTWPITPSTTGCSGLTDPEALAITQNGDALVPDFHNGTGTLNAATSSLYFILTTAGSCTQVSGATQEAGLNSPFGVTVDGNDYAYITNRGNGGTGNSISVLNMQSSPYLTFKSVSPATGYVPQYVVNGSLTAELNGPLNIASSPDGSVWVTNYNGNLAVQLIGLAYPTTTPLASAAQTIANNFTVGTVGLRP